jgi:serine/threonine protein kinase
VKLLDHFKFRQHVVIVFECLSYNLYKYMQLNKRKYPVFDHNLLKQVVRQITMGLKYMQNSGVIHCDLKPENVLFTDNNFNNVKLIDFGASCEDFSTGFFYVQSRYYRAPEIVLGIEYDHAVDMWSLGCIIYELIIGTPLFPAKDENELVEYLIITLGEIPHYMLDPAKKYKQFFSKPGGDLDDIIRSPVTSLGKGKLQPGAHPIKKLLHNKTSPECIDFINKCLALDPEDRMQPQAALHHKWLLEI